MCFFLLFSFSASTDVYVMAPLTILNEKQEIQDQERLEIWFNQLSQNQVDGIMIDIWWGITEPTPKNYNFTGYQQLFTLMQSYNLKIIPVLSFHQCGGNVGDTCNFPLPSFVTDSDIRPFWVDAEGNVDREYISFGFDNIMIGNRTPIEMYSGFMSAFKSTFSDFIQKKIFPKIEIGLGPCGELRFPSYQLTYWSYPGCGEFQSYDSELTNKLKNDAIQQGVPDFGHNPINTGGYNSVPSSSEFWQTTWKGDYGQWFIKWYSNLLLDHARSVLSESRKIFPNSLLSAKIAGIHWWYLDDSHCAETTAGFNNFLLHDGYRDILTVFRRYSVDVCFTCLEMAASGDSGSDPPTLIEQIIQDSKWASLRFEGENALAVYDSDSYDRIFHWKPEGLSTFTYLRLCDDLMSDANFPIFSDFVLKMKSQKYFL